MIMMMNANVCMNRWNTYVVDGHDVEALCNAFLKASSVKDKPTCILAKTFKGRGIPGVEDLDNWHGKPIGNKGKEVMDFIGQQILNQGPSGLHPCPPSENVAEIEFGGVTLSEAPRYKLGEQVQSLMSCMSCNIELNAAMFWVDIKNISSIMWHVLDYVACFGLCGMFWIMWHVFDCVACITVFG